MRQRDYKRSKSARRARIPCSVCNRVLTVAKRPATRGLISLTVAVILAGASLDAAAAAWSIEDFNRRKPDWDRMGGARTTLTLEGRYSLLSGQTLRFTHCDLTFRLPDASSQLIGRSQTIEVSGRLVREDRRLHFAVDHLKELPTDAETFRSRQMKLANPQPAELYELANWAARRGRFYDDTELIELASEAYRQGIVLEWRKLPKDDSDARFALAAKVAKLQLPDSLRLELVHEALHVAWRLLPKTGGNEEQRRPLANRIAKELPGSSVPLPDPQPKLRQKYLEDPLATYQAADADQRERLHRILYSAIALELIEFEVRKNGGNGFEIARQIETQLPELLELAASYRERELDDRLSNVGTAGRQEMLELVSLFRGRNDDKRAQETLRKWLVAREKKLRPDGPEGLMQLAREYIDLLKDEERATSLLIEADELSPNSDVIVKQLERLGYRKENGRWTNDRRPPSPAKSEIDKAVDEGRVAIGMTAEQVLTSLGTPDTVARMATSRAICAVWRYDSGLTIHLKHPIRRPEPTVVAVSHIRGH